MWFACVLVLYIAGGFRLKYAASHISEALDNADWRGGKDEEEICWPSFHSDGPLFFLSTVCELCTEAEYFRKKKNILKKKVTCQGLGGQSLRTCAWEILFPLRYFTVSCTPTVHVTPGPFPFSLFLIVLHWGLKWLTYYLIIRKFRFWGNFFGFYITAETSLNWKKVLIHLFL